MISPKILEKPWDLKMKIAPKITTKNGELNYHCVGFKAKKGRKAMVFTVKSRDFMPVEPTRFELTKIVRTDMRFSRNP